MKRCALRFAVIAATVLAPGLATAEINMARAHYNYQMFCMGCHTPNGIGGNSVPKLKGFIGHFLKSQQGREYLVRVPGSANSALNDEQLAEVLNWKIQRFAEGSAPPNWQAFQAEEVGRYRQDPLLEVVEYRKTLVRDLMAKNNIKQRLASDE
jgi:cytochrome c553